jgi:2-C-methyl-D-erythritol 4-phosphate cytidylyltransferase
MNELAKYAVIVAGGTGSRMGAGVAKQFLLIKGKPVFRYSVDSFLSAYDDLQVILVVPEGSLEKEELKGLDKDRILIVNGGATRFDSVKNGLALVKKESIVFVHDAVRCLVSVSLIHRCYEQARQLGSAIPAIASKDSIRLLEADGSRPFDRNKVMLVQTPQTFRSSLLLPAFEKTYDPAFTDEATVVEASGQKVQLIEGEENNIKITRPADLVIAESFL